MITGCIVNLTITPTWEGGQKKSCHTEGHEPQPYSSQSSLNNSAFDTSTDVVIHQTPSKKDKRKNQVDPENICRLCGILWETEEDKSHGLYKIFVSVISQNLKCSSVCKKIHVQQKRQT